MQTLGYQGNMCLKYVIMTQMSHTLRRGHAKKSDNPLVD